MTGRLKDRDEQLARYDLAIRLRAQGLSFGQMAPLLGVKDPTSAQQIYRSARAAQIPEVPVAHGRIPPPLWAVAWAAGFFDGEGCAFGYESVQGGYRRFTFGLQISQVAREPLDRLLEHWGGSIRRNRASNPRQRDQWAWACRGAEAAAFLGDVLPYLTVKRAAAEAILPCLHRTHRHGVPFTAAEIEMRRAAIAALRETNRRGRAVA